MPRLAASLRRLGREVDALFPHRTFTSDGWIGDAAHQARQSDHNPDGRGIVHALDITSARIEPWVVVVAACVHPSTNYVIFRGRIFSRTHRFVGRFYEGPDRHMTHIHVSILTTPVAERSVRPWLHLHG